ncbi:UbiA prenyltransferase family [Lyophyllum atratum]|nr:UbiA prenyltransferase family [Lyophyllum atratum]
MRPSPSQFRLYFELNRLHWFPAGTALLFWPAAWALTMASYRTSKPIADYAYDLAIYLFATTLVHSAACVWSDICDREIDSQERTKNRPLACGAISVKGAVIMLLLELSIAIALLTCISDPFVIALGAFGIFPLHALYPLMKRVTNWPQLFLGGFVARFTMNWGFVVVWAIQVKEDSYRAPAVFFLGTVCWSMVYDTIYGCQDRLDDIKAGVKSTALLFGTYVREILAVFAVLFVAAMVYTGILNEHGWPYYVIAVGGTSLHLTWQLATLKPDVAADCMAKFKANTNLGYIAWAGMLADYLMRVL